MLSIILYFVMGIFAGPQNTSAVTFEPCVWPNRCAQAAQVFEPCVWPNRCARVAVTFEPCVWPNLCANSDIS